MWRVDVGREEHGYPVGQAVADESVASVGDTVLASGQDVNQVTVVEVTARVNGKLWPNNGTHTGVRVRVEGLGLGWRG